MTINSASTILFANPATKRIFGYGPDELLGQPLTLLMPEYLRYVHEQALGRYLDTRKRHIEWEGVELPGLHKDGHEIALEVSFGESEVDGKHLFTGIIRDVSERKRMEERHQQAEERFRILIEGIKDYAIYMLDKKGRVTSWNSGAERIKGYEADEVIGQDFSLFYPTEDLKAGKHQRDLEVAESEGRYEEEGWRVRKDGSTFWAHSLINALFDDKEQLVGFAKITRDAGERKRAEEERSQLLENEQMARREAEEAQQRMRFLSEASKILGATLDYSTTLDNLAKLVVGNLADWCTINLLDQQGELQLVALTHSNASEIPVAQELHHLPLPTARTHRALFRALHTGHPELYTHLNEELLPEISDIAEQKELLRRIGVHPALIVPLTVRNRVLGAISLARSEATAPFDQDDANLATELANRAAIAVENANLYRHSQDLNRELEERVLERTKDLESFSYTVSHDLRAPLRAIDGFSKALDEDYTDHLDETARGYIGRVRGAAKRMGELIDDLLDLSRLSTGEARWDDIDISETAERIAEELRHRNPERNAKITIQLDLNARADQRLVKVLLENLLENSWKFTGKRTNARIEVGKATTDRGEAFYVRDNGAGFNMSYAPRLFAPFQRLHNPQDFEGTGIGLATVKRIIDLHDGEIWATGAVDKGATFYFTLPPKQ